MNNPKLFPSSGYENLNYVIDRGKYCVFRDRFDLPKDIEGVGGLSSSENYVGTLLAASTTSNNPPPIGGIRPASSCPIYEVLSFRKDVHMDGIAHVNMDKTLIFKDTNGNALKMTATDRTEGSGHFEELASDSGLDILGDIYELPTNTHGSFSDLKSSGVRPHFSTGPSPEKSE